MTPAYAINDPWREPEPESCMGCDGEGCAECGGTDDDRTGPGLEPYDYRTTPADWPF